MLKQVTDRNAIQVNGYLAIAVAVMIGILLALYNVVILGAYLFCLVPLLTGFRVLEPNDARVLTFLGQYVGTLKNPGFILSIPFTKADYVSMRYVNFDTGRIKVNDATGNPIEIGAVVVWRVRNAAQAVFNVDYYSNFVSHQSDIAVRTIAASFPYDHDTDTSLRGNTGEVSDMLVQSLQQKLEVAGIEVQEVRISNLAYSSEIASAMLRKQQAEAVVLARKKILENALTLADGVIKHVDGTLNGPMSDEARIAMMSNLLVVLVSDKDSVPTVSVGN